MFLQKICNLLRYCPVLQTHLHPGKSEAGRTRPVEQFVLAWTAAEAAQQKLLNRSYEHYPAGKNCPRDENSAVANIGKYNQDYRLYFYRNYLDHCCAQKSRRRHSALRLALVLANLEVH